jgi:hypothetical protein
LLELEHAASAAIAPETHASAPSTTALREKTALMGDSSEGTYSRAT